MLKRIRNHPDSGVISSSIYILKYVCEQMSETQPALSLRYTLNLEESQDGFALATFGKKQFTRFITPLISIGIIIWGFFFRFQWCRSLLRGFRRILFNHAIAARAIGFYQ